MDDITECNYGYNEYGDNSGESLNEIRKNLLEDFETAKTVSKILKGSSKLSGVSGEREPVKVFLRVRPFTNKEITANESQGCLEIQNSSTVLMHPPKTSFTFKHQNRNAITAETVHRFSFSRVFGPDTSQKAFFEDTSLSVVKDFIDGQNCLVFSYGVTNAGKTYTILGNPQNLGILPRTINILFNSFKNQNYDRTNLKPKMFCDVVKLSSIQEEREESKKNMLLSLIDFPTYHSSVNSTDSSLQDISNEQSSSHEVLDAMDLSSVLDVTSVDVETQGPIQFALWISFAEIYNENVYDLLEPISLSKERKRTVLKVGDDRKGNPYIKGLTEIHVNNAEEALKLLKIGRKNQKIASTKLNENSSRSHCIFTLKILSVVNTKEPHVARVSRLSFVDLAGSERYTKTHNTGVRLKEAGNINTSIMTLGKCVELLRYNQNHTNNQKNIPFRESKLTRLFQGFFCGKGKASMIVNVNQCASAFDETLHALKFSAIAKKVTTVVQAPQPLLPPPEASEPPSSKPIRMSVAWADGSLSTPAGNKVHSEVDEPEEAAPLAEEENSDIRAPPNQELHTLVTVLREQLIEERKKMASLEIKIREEVCLEMAEQMVEIENNYNERLLEDQRMNEDLYEKRMDLLTKSVKRSRKRARVERIVDDDDEWVSSVLLHKEEVKTKEMNQKIADLEKRLEETTSNSSREVERFQKELSGRDAAIKSLEMTLKDCKAELETKTSQLMAAKKIQGGRPVTPTKAASNNNLVKQLEQRLEETTVALDKKNSQLISKNNVIAKLEDSLKGAQKDLQEREKELAELKVEMELSKNEKNSKEIEDLLAAREKENAETTENLKFVEGELEILNNKDKENQKELAKLAQDRKQLEDEVNELKKEAEKSEELRLDTEKQLEEKESSHRDTVAKLEDMKATAESTERELQRREIKIAGLNETIEGLNKQLAELQASNSDLRETNNRALTDLANTQATVDVRNQKLEQFECLDKSLKDAYREMETEVMNVKRQLEDARNELQNKEKNINQIKHDMEKRMKDEVLKVQAECECVTGRMKIGLAEQDEVLSQMEKEMIAKENELTELREVVDKLNKDLTEKKEKLEKLSEENEIMDDQVERLKIKVFELETEVQKLQQEIKKETSKKDSATQALRDGLEIVKAKKAEYETKTNEVKQENEEMKVAYEKKIKDLREEVERLKSDGSDEKTTPEKSSSSSSSDEDKNNTYLPVEVESFNLPTNDRVEIDVTPITGSGLIKAGKKTGSAKSKTLKRKSSDLTLKEIKDQINSKKPNTDCSEDDFTPVSVTKLRKTRSSSVSGRSRQSKANVVPSPSSFSLSTLDENSENTRPLTSQGSQKSSASGKRRFFNKLGIPESGKSKPDKLPTAPPTSALKKRRKLLKKTEISLPCVDSPFSKSDKVDVPTPVSRAQDLITRHLRSRIVKTAR